MKPTAALLACTLVAALPLGAQNLVPNPSFEDYVQCPDDLFQINEAVGWTAVIGSPDYFHACSDTLVTDVPANGVGYQFAFDGDAYIGCGTYATWGLVREIVQAELLTPMVLGQSYHISMQVSPGGFGYYTVGLASNGIGLRFSTVPLNWSLALLDNAPTLHLSTILQDTAQWTAVAGSFVADSAYSFVQIGNFFTDALTQSVVIDPDAASQAAYAFIDDVCVSLNPNDCATAEGIEDPHTNALQLYPNPAVDHVILTATGPGSAFASVVLLDANGRSVPVQVVRNAGRELTLRWAQPLAPGVYVVRAALKSGERFTERVVVN